MGYQPQPYQQYQPCPTQQQPQPEPPKNKKRKLLIAAVVIVVVVMLILAVILVAFPLTSEDEQVHDLSIDPNGGLNFVFTHGGGDYSHTRITVEPQDGAKVNILLYRSYGYSPYNDTIVPLKKWDNSSMLVWEVDLPKDKYILRFENDDSEVLQIKLIIKRWK